METLLKKPEIFRDSMGRFDRHGKTLSKTAKRTNGHLIKKNEEIKRESDGKFSKGQGGPRAGAGRPKGSLNKVSKALKDMILASLDRVGGEEHLAKLAIENSSAFSSLLGKILRTQLATDAESNPLIADQVAGNYRKADITPRQRAMLDFAMKVAQQAHSVDEADSVALREHGFSDDEI